MEAERLAVQPALAWYGDNEPETRAALDLIFADHFSRYGTFGPVRRIA